jgi:hypothetical protein
MVPSWSENGTQLLTKKACYLLSILFLAIEPVSLSSLINWFDYKNEKFFRDQYLKLLKERGLIDLTNPDKPTSPDNKYQATVDGKLFLGGGDKLPPPLMKNVDKGL